MKHQILPPLLSLAAVLGALGLPSPANATITVSNYWRMGETEIIGQGGAPAFAADIVGGKTLFFATRPVGDAAVASSAANSVNSSVALNFFASGVYGTNAGVISSATNNFGLEFWVKPQNTNGSKCLAYNGDPDTNGWGIYLTGGSYQCRFGGVIAFGSVTATANVWTHLALVRQGSAAIFYVNGVASVSTPSAPKSPVGRFGVAIKPTDTTQDQFIGSVDELRVFTFTQGQFSTNDLLVYSVQPFASNLHDNGPGSLRQAILIANGNSGPTVISAANIIPGTIPLASPLPIITNSITINGPGMSNLTISGSGTNRIFFVDAPGAAVNINNLTLANGRAKGGKGGSGYGGGGGLGAGGALFANAGAVTLVSVGLSNNAAIGGAGGDAGVKGGGGGGGFGGDGGAGLYLYSSGGGGGGFGGRGGNGGGGGAGGGGLIGNGGGGSSGMNYFSGGGGGALGDGQTPDGTNATGGAGGTGGGGNGGNDNGGTGTIGASDGQGGQNDGGGGGGGLGLANIDGYVGTGGNGGAGGKFGGGGGAKHDGVGGTGGDFGGGGGAAAAGGGPPQISKGGDGGFGGGGGGTYGNRSGWGGFGGGSGACIIYVGAAGAFAGIGGSDEFSRGAGGGGGAALGGAIFVRGDNGASITLADTVPDNATLTAGTTGSIGYNCNDGNATCATPGSVAGSAMFLLGGTNTITVNSGSKTITGSIGGWTNAPTTFVKTGGGTLVLTGTNTYAGGTLLSAGTLSVAVPSNLGESNNAINFDGGGLQITGTAFGTNAASVALNALAPIEVFDPSGSATFSGPWSGAGSFAKNGSGTFILSAANAYTGGTTLNSGMLGIGHDRAFGTGAITINGGAVRAVNGLRTVTNAIALNGDFALGRQTTFAGGATLNSDITITATNLDLSVGVSGFSGAISGAHSITLAAGGGVTAERLFLTGKNTFTGALRVAGALLSITTGGGVANAASSGINGGGQVTVSGSGSTWTNTFDVFVGDAGGAGTLLIENGGVVSDTFALAGRPGGSGSVTVSGGGSEWIHSAGLVIGLNGGSGTMNISSGGQVANVEAVVGREAGSMGTVLLTGSNSIWSSSGYIDIGQSGTGVVTIAQGAVIAANQGGVGNGTIKLASLGGSSGTLNIGMGGPAASAGYINAAVVLGGSGSGAKLLNFNHNNANYVVNAMLNGSLSVQHNGLGVTVLSMPSTYTGGTTINHGTLLANNPTGSGTGSGAVFVASGATLGGNGSVAGNTTVAGTLSPGNSPGLLTFANNLTLTSSSVTLMELAGDTRGATNGYDAINVGGALSFGGKLKIVFVNGFTPAAGSSFNLFDSGSTMGSFNTFEFPALAGGLEWNTNALYTSGTLSVSMATNSPQPSLDLARQSNGFVLSWPTNDAAFSLEYTTNLSPAIWISNSSPPAIVNGRYTMTNDALSPSRFYRLKK